jgi:hypothetical protein
MDEDMCLKMRVMSDGPARARWFSAMVSMTKSTAVVFGDVPNTISDLYAEIDSLSKKW